MSVADRCRATLKRLELHRRENIESPVPFSFTDLLPGGQKPTALAEIELLDAITSYLTLKCADEFRFPIFCQLFPLGGDLHVYQLDYLIKLSSLAISLGLPLMLDFVSLWIKIRIAQIFGYSVPTIPNPDPTVSQRILTQYVTRLNQDLLNMQELALKSGNNNQSFLSLSVFSPVFTDAYISAVTLTHGFPPFLISSSDPLPKPPLALVHLLIHWLRTARSHHKSHHSFTLTSVDWPIVFRHHASGLCTHSIVEQLIACSPSVPVSLAWWTVCCLNNQKTTCVDECNGKSNMTTALADLHYEMLQCLLDNPTALPSDGHRGGSSSSSSVSGTGTNWHVICSRKSDHTTDFQCLQRLVRHVADCYPESLSTTMDDSELMVLRLAEFLQIAWFSGRIRHLSSDGFSKLVSPLDQHKVFELMKARLRR